MTKNIIAVVGATGGPKRGPDDKLKFTLPMDDKKLPGIAAEDIGKCALAIFTKGREYIGKTVGIAGEHLNGAEMAAKLTKALRQEVRYNAVSPDEHRKFGFPGADDLGNMFQFMWLARNKSRIPLA